MNEQESDHWAEIGSTLGASPPPQEEKEQLDEKASQGQPADAVPVRIERRHARPKPTVKRTAADWSKLAGDLGVDIEPPADFAPVTEPSAEPDVLSSSAVGSDEDETALVQTDEGVMFISPALDADEDSASQTADIELEAEGKKAGKRRRKRRRRTHKPDDAESAAAVDDDTQLEFDEPSEMEVFMSDDSDDLAPAESLASSEAEAPRKSKRRRRRRGAPGKKDSDKTLGASSEDEAGRPIDALSDEPPLAESIAVGAFEDESADVEDTAFDGEETSSRDEKQERPSHRGIPTWREAVDIVISANLEARAKRPNGKSSSRQRSGHRPPQRDKPADKSS